MNILNYRIIKTPLGFQPQVSETPMSKWEDIGDVCPTLEHAKSIIENDKGVQKSKNTVPEIVWEDKLELD